MFAILKYGARVTQMETMDDIFITCCSIYNQRMRQAIVKVLHDALCFPSSTIFLKNLLYSSLFVEINLTFKLSILTLRD